MELKRKLAPARFTRMSPRMAAMVGYIVGEIFTEPFIASVIVTNDGFVLAMDGGDSGYNTFIGSESDLKRNWASLLACAGLTADEHAEASRLFALKVQRAFTSPSELN